LRRAQIAPYDKLQMRTGLIQEPLNASQDAIEQVMGVVATMLEQAIRDAAAYAAQAQRSTVQPRDLELALKRLVLPGSEYWTNPELPAEAAAARAALCTPDSEASSDELDEPASGDPLETEIWVQAEGSKLVDEMNAAPELFNAWNPDSPLLAALKRATEQASASFG
jgi:histone H3/H4